MKKIKIKKSIQERIRRLLKEIEKMQLLLEYEKTIISQEHNITGEAQIDLERMEIILENGK